MMLGIGSVLGALFGPDEKWGLEARKLPIQFFIATLAISLSCCLRALGTFGNERPAFWRERNSGVSTFAYFTAKMLTDFIWIFAYPVAFLMSWKVSSIPRGMVSVYYRILVAVAWAASGQGYALSVLLKPEKAKFTGLISVLLCMMFSGLEPTLPSLPEGLMKDMFQLSFGRWALEALFVTEIDSYPLVYKRDPTIKNLIKR